MPYVGNMLPSLFDRCLGLQSKGAKIVLANLQVPTQLLKNMVHIISAHNLYMYFLTHNNSF